MLRYSLFRELVNISSPSLKEESISLFIKTYLTNLGFIYREDNFGNLLFFKALESAEYCLVAHMDTVEGANVAHLMEDEERFFTDKTTALGADDKCAIAVMLELAKECSCDNVAFLFFIGEEIGLYGSSHMDKALLEGLEDSLFFVLDAEGEIGTIINEAVGKSRITFTCHGKASHAGFAPEKGINAIRVLSQIALELPQGRPDEISTCNIGSFIAEGSTNVVSSLAKLTFELRSLDDSNRKKLEEKIIKKSQEIAQDSLALLDVKVEDLYKHYKIDKEDEIVLKAKKAIESIKLKAQITSTTGGSDANSLNSFGYKAIVLTCGYFNPHGVEEYIYKRELDKLYFLVKKLIS